MMRMPINISHGSIEQAGKFKYGICEYIDRLSSFNLIHLETAMKMDVFIQKQSSYQDSDLKRRQKDTLIKNDKSSKFYFSSPEDIILSNRVLLL